MRKTLKKIMTDLILDDGYTSYDKLSCDEQRNLVAEMICNEHTSSLFEVLTESKNSENNIHHLIVYLKDSSPDNALDLADTLADNAMNYYYDRLVEMFNDLYNEIASERNNEAGLTPIVDAINGETRWIR